MKNNGQDEPIPPESEENTHFTCKFCGDTYGEDRFLQEHIKSVHEKRQQYECTLCDAILLGKDEFWSNLHYRFSNVKFIYSEKATNFLRNLPLTFDYSTYSQKLGEDFAKCCGLLRIYEL